MSRFNYEMTPQKIETWLKEGRGSGTGKDYKPWLTVFDLASQGESNRVPGIKEDREYHVFSRNEEGALDIFQLSPWLKTIREQFPLLPLVETETIADLRKIDHPHVYYTKDSRKQRVNIVMTTDFLITLTINGQDHVIALTVKERSDLGILRTIEKLEIERYYWMSRNIPWGIIVAEDIPKILKKNCQIFVDYFSFEKLQIEKADLVAIYNELTPLVMQKEIGLRLLTKECDRKLGLDTGTSLKAAQHFIATRSWPIDWNTSFSPGKILEIRDTDKNAHFILSGGVE